jgi:hypothetical protein
LPSAPCLGFAVFLLRAAAGLYLRSRKHPLFAFGRSFRVFGQQYLPGNPKAPGPLMGFASLQHLRGRGPLTTGQAGPATFRLQGLLTLLTVFSLESRAGSVSHRQRSWDSPFGGLLLPSSSQGPFGSGRTHLPFALPLFPALKAPARPGRPRFLGSCRLGLPMRHAEF